MWKRERKVSPKTHVIQNPEVNHCADCGATISDKVRDYSQKQYGRPLCMRYQHTAKNIA